MALTLILNGRSQTFDGLTDGSTLRQLLETLGLKADRVAVERNGGIVARGAWSDTVLGSADRLEIVHFVGGGAGSL